MPARIWRAISEGDIALLRHLFDANPAEIDGCTFFGGGTYLHYAAAHGSLTVVRAMLDIGFDVNKPGEHQGDRAISTAASAGNCEIVEHLLDNGALLDVSASIRNPLFSCIVGCSDTSIDRDSFHRIARLLLVRGTDATACYNSPTMVEMDAMAFARMWGRDDIALTIAQHLYGQDTDRIDGAMEEADVVAEGNARSRTKFRRLRYPPKSSKGRS